MSNETFGSVWDALADTPGEAANLKTRSELMQQIQEIIKRKGWTQAQAAKRCGVTQPRINDLARGRISLFSIDALVNIVSGMGGKVHIQIEAA